MIYILSTETTEKSNSNSPYSIYIEEQNFLLSQQIQIITIGIPYILR